MPKYSGSPKKLKLTLVTVIAGALLLLGLAAVTMLASSSQDLRQQASGSPAYAEPPSGCGRTGDLFNTGAECFICQNYSFVPTDSSNCYAVPRNVVFGPTINPLSASKTPVPLKPSTTPAPGARKCGESGGLVKEGNRCFWCREDGIFVDASCPQLAGGSCGYSGQKFDTGSQCYACKNNSFVPVSKDNCGSIFVQPTTANTQVAPVRPTAAPGITTPTPKQVKVRIKFQR